MTFPREGKFTSSHFFASKDVMGRPWSELIAKMVMGVVPGLVT